jgi:uncharacterized protein (DUF433 family)
MIEVAVEYVVRTEAGGWRVSNSRVSLDSVVHAYREGQSPEAIAGSFPSLSLEQVHGAIAFYLRNEREIDEYLAAQDERWEQLRQQSEVANADLLERLRARRSRAGAPDDPAR